MKQQHYASKHVPHHRKKTAVKKSTITKKKITIASTHKKHVKKSGLE